MQAGGERFCFVLVKLENASLLCIEQSQLLILQWSLGRAGNDVPMHVRVCLLTAEREYVYSLRTQGSSHGFGSRMDYALEVEVLVQSEIASYLLAMGQGGD